MLSRSNPFTAPSPARNSQSSSRRHRHLEHSQTYQPYILSGRSARTMSKIYWSCWLMVGYRCIECAWFEGLWQEKWRRYRVNNIRCIHFCPSAKHCNRFLFIVAMPRLFVSAKRSEEDCVLLKIYQIERRTRPPLKRVSLCMLSTCTGRIAQILYHRYHLHFVGQRIGYLESKGIVRKVLTTVIL